MVKGFLFFAALAAIATLAQAATMEDEVRAVFDKYIAVQNAHDLKSMRSLLADSPDLLWISRRVAQVYAPTQLTVGEPGVEPARNRVYINLVMVKKPEGWQIVSILPILVPPQ